MLRDTFKQHRYSCLKYLAMEKMFYRKQVLKQCEFNCDAKKLRLARNVGEDYGARLTPPQRILNNAL